MDEIIAKKRAFTSVRTLEHENRTSPHAFNSFFLACADHRNTLSNTEPRRKISVSSASHKFDACREIIPLTSRTPP